MDDHLNREEVQLWLDSLHYSAGIFSQLSDEIGLAEGWWKNTNWAGTVLDAETARVCILAGAQYIVGPSFNEGCARLCNRYAVPYIPGVMTPQEAVRALEFGADILKLFPAELFGPKIISAFKGPLPQGIYMPTGGITAENAADWIKAGAAVLGIGGALTKGAKTGDFESVTRTARQLKEAIAAARSK